MGITQAVGLNHSIVGLDTSVVSFLFGHRLIRKDAQMPKLNSNTKFYIILGTVIFFGLCLLGLGVAALQGNQANQNTSTEPDASTQDQYQARMEQGAQEANQKAYEECIETANKLFDDYVAKIPKNLTIEEYGVARQSFEDLRENHKEDCDRQYKN